MSMPPLTGDRKFRDEVVRIAELTVNTSVLEGLEFSNCRIIGPAVLAFIDHVSVVGCSWDAPDMNAIRWTVEPDRMMIGAVGVLHCTFSNCRFEGIGIAGTPEFFEQIANGFNSN